MSRTRIVFFAILAVCLAVIAASLALQAISERMLLQLFVGAAIFGVGVVALDFLGILGGHHDTAGHDFAAGDASAGHFDVGHVGDHGGHVTDSGADAGGHGHAGDHTADHAPSHHPDATHPANGRGQASAVPILSALTYLRLLVYFCLGFGPAGWAGVATGQGPLLSLAIATPVGLAALFLAQAFFRFQRRDTDSQLTSGDLLGAIATVIVPLDAATMGKVRIQVGLSVTDQYALAADPEVRFATGDPGRVVKVTDECVYIR
jgi:membrane protein implicated in regulation of membrane protease activity